MKTNISSTLVHPSNFIKKLGWGDLCICALLSSLKLSVTGDTAKYLDFTLCRGCTIYPHDLVCASSMMHILLKWTDVD